jgi:hypothetical protein
MCRKVLAAAVCAAALLAGGCGDEGSGPGGGSTAPGGVPRAFWGVVSGTALDAHELDMMGRARVGTLRQLVLWPEIEPSADDEYDWSKLDALVAGAAKNGIEMLPFVYGTPQWAVGDCLGLDPIACQRIPPIGSKQSKQAWQDFLHDLVSRYGPDGTFWSDDSDEFDPPKLPITEWQIWNEPSSPTFYQPTPSPLGYAELVRISHDAITEVDPDAEIVLAGLFRTPQKGQGEEGGPAGFLSALYAVQGIREDFDAIALHPYASNLDQIVTLFDQVRPVMRDAGDAGTPVWITELGWSSAPPEPNKPLLKGLKGQAKLLTDSFDLLRSKREEWNLEGVIWYQWRDLAQPVEGCTFCQLSGLFDTAGQPKPAWNAFNDFTGGAPG